MKIEEGYLDVPGGKVWYRAVGDNAEATPLLCLHGGPGFTHYYLEPLEALADRRRVIFYDQLGCGRSDRPEDARLWTVERAVAELGILRRALAQGPIHLLGHSWGSMLAVDYALANPDHLVSLVLASPAISMPRWVADLRAYRDRLPPPVREALTRHETAGTTDTPEYEAATAIFYQHHLCRMQPWPEPLLRSIEGAGSQVYATMWGPNEFFVTGNLADYDRTLRLGELRMPVLLTCGRFDEATPEACAWYQQLLPEAELAVFEASAHVPHLEETDAYLQVVSAFLRRAEARPAT
jgi:proline iminopeptidase